MAAAVLTLLSLIYLGGLAALLCVAYSRHHFNRYTAVKAAVSCGFLVTYLLGGHTADAYFRGLLPCFVLCLAGDVLLGLANNHAGFFGRWFLLGVGAFTLAHAGFCVLFTLAMPGGPRFTLWDAAAPLAALAVTAACARHKRFKLRRMHMELPALAYSLCVGLMCARGWRSALPAADGAALAAVGAALFLISTRCCCSFIFMSGRAKRCVR
ncbi:MAG: lysoplasmalogenase family protein [Ruthenibacterium lactatiformans]